MVLTKVLLLLLFSIAVINRVRAVTENKSTRMYHAEFRYYIMAVCALLAAGVSLLFVLKQSWLQGAQFNAGQTLNWLGNVLITFAISLWVWSKRTLGKNWSSRIAVRQQHTLTASGPYRFIRHPIYTSYLILMFGIAFATGNWLVAFPYVLGALLTITRTGQEELVLRQTLGKEYELYSRRTGRFFPPLFRYLKR